MTKTVTIPLCVMKLAMYKGFHKNNEIRTGSWLIFTVKCTNFYSAGEKRGVIKVCAIFLVIEISSEL